jgi:hypothetical protein
MSKTLVIDVEGPAGVDKFGDPDQFLISDYEFFQKGFELWANHFMGVFYMWTGVVVVPTTAASLLADLDVFDSGQAWLFGVICIAVALIGWYVSLKMFDIRRAQLMYAQQLNAIRCTAYDKMGITSRYGLKPFGQGANLKESSKTDFGRFMALAMSAVHGLLMVLGVSSILLKWWAAPLVTIPGLLLGLVFCWRNYAAYFRMVPEKL